MEPVPFIRFDLPLLYGEHPRHQQGSRFFEGQSFRHAVCLPISDPASRSIYTLTAHNHPAIPAYHQDPRRLVLKGGILLRRDPGQVVQKASCSPPALQLRSARPLTRHHQFQGASLRVRRVSGTVNRTQAESGICTFAVPLRMARHRTN